MNYCFPKSARLRTRRQFQRIAHQPTRHIGNWIVIEARESKCPHVRVGITVTKRFGNSVQRNRFKRIVREAFRICRHRLLQGFDLNIKPRNASHKASSKHILTDLIALAARPNKSEMQ